MSRAAAALNHPNICTIHEIGTAEDRDYIAFELIEGQTLDALLRAECSFELKEIFAGNGSCGQRIFTAFANASWMTSSAAISETRTQVTSPSCQNTVVTSPSR